MPAVVKKNPRTGAGLHFSGNDSSAYWHCFQRTGTVEFNGGSSCTRV
jgi:hypothetical protein